MSDPTVVLVDTNICVDLRCLGNSNSASVILTDLRRLLSKSKCKLVISPVTIMELVSSPQQQARSLQPLNGIIYGEMESPKILWRQFSRQDDFGLVPGECFRATDWAELRRFSEKKYAAIHKEWLEETDKRHNFFKSSQKKHQAECGRKPRETGDFKAFLTDYGPKVFLEGIARSMLSRVLSARDIDRALRSFPARFIAEFAAAYYYTRYEQRNQRKSTKKSDVGDFSIAMSIPFAHHFVTRDGLFAETLSLVPSAKGQVTCIRNVEDLIPLVKKLDSTPRGTQPSANLSLAGR